MRLSSSRNVTRLKQFDKSPTNIIFVEGEIEWNIHQVTILPIALQPRRPHHNSDLKIHETKQFLLFAG